jgi:hypothetical protein
MWAFRPSLRRRWSEDIPLNPAPTMITSYSCVGGEAWPFVFVFVFVSATPFVLTGIEAMICFYSSFLISCGSIEESEKQLDKQLDRING